MSITQCPSGRRRWPDLKAAQTSKRFLAGGQLAQECGYGCGGFHLESEVKPAAARRQPARPAADTGFPAAVKEMIRVRAGLGNAEDAHCEACGAWLGAKDGQCHHRQNRGMGGSRYRNTVQNGGLVCGTPFTECHGLATRLDSHMIEAGWVLRSGRDPLLVPVMLFSHGGSGLSPVWLTAAGTYAFDPPAGAVAS